MVGKLSECYKGKFVQTIVVLFGVIMAIVSIATAVNAYTMFTSSTGEYGDLISSWTKAPITDILLSSSATCPDSYNLLTTPKWPGRGRRLFQDCRKKKKKSGVVVAPTYRERGASHMHRHTSEKK